VNLERIPNVCMVGADLCVCPYTDLQAALYQYLPGASHLVNNVNFQLTAATFERQSGRQNWIGARFVIKDREERTSK